MRMLKAAACADPDAQPLTDEQLAQFEALQCESHPRKVTLLSETVC